MTAFRRTRTPAWQCFLLLSALAIVLGFALRVHAQTETQAPLEEIPLMKPPQVSDPMLAPPPPPQRQLRSWDEALELIRHQAPDYLSSEAGLARAEAQIGIARAAVLPLLNGQGSYTHQFFVARIPFNNSVIVAPPPDVFAAGATLVWPVLNLRGYHGIGTAHRNANAERLAFEDARRVLASMVVAAMLATLAGERVAELNRVGLRSALERLALTEARQEFGQGTALDVDRAQQDVAAARAQLIDGDEQLLRAREALGVALGSKTPLAAPGDLDLGEFERAVSATCKLNSEIENRPDIAAARARLEVAERGVDDVKLQFVPSVNLQSTASYASKATLSPNGTWMVQGVLNVPIYEGGARFAALDDARAAVTQAREALVAARLHAIVESAQATRAVSVLTASRDVAKQQRDLAARIDLRTRSGYAQGLGTSLDLVISAQALRQSEIDLTLLEFQVGRARADAALTNAECLY